MLSRSILKPGLLISGAVLLLGLTAWFLLYRSSGNKTGESVNKAIYLEIGSTRLNVEIANTLKTRSQGLSGRGELAEGWGMLFVFEEPGLYPFWMKDVNFPLDIIWIAENWQIVGLEQNVSPSSYPTTFKSSQPVLYVLEVNAGFAAQQQVATGQTVRLVEEASP